MTYTALIFDFFGVFAPDVFAVWLQKHVTDLEATQGYFLDLARAADEGKLPKTQLLQALANKSGQTPAEVEDELNAFSINQPLIALLAKLAPDYRTSLLCNGSSAMVSPILEANGLKKLFNSIILSSDVGMAKPQPEIYALALERMGATAAETIFIDDRAINIAGAEKAGITGIQYHDFAQLEASLRSLHVL